MTPSPQLDGRVAIVTGGTRGIGLAVAGALVREGARVAITGLREAHFAAAREALGAADRVHAIQADVRDPAAAARAVEETVRRFGGLDVLVNNAGVGAFANVADQTVDDWRAVIETNVSGVFYCCRAAIPHLRRRGGGWIVNVSSLASKNPFAGGAAYSASKAALNAFSEALMQEVRYDGIRVSYVLPGSVRTGFAGHEEDAGAEWKLAPEDVARVVLDLVSHPARSLPSRVELRPAQPRRSR